MTAFQEACISPRTRGRTPRPDRVLVCPRGPRSGRASLHREQPQPVLQAEPRSMSQAVPRAVPRAVRCGCTFLRAAAGLCAAVFILTGFHSAEILAEESPTFGLSLAHYSWSLDTEGGGTHFGQTAAEALLDWPALFEGVSARVYLPMHWTRDGESDTALDGLGDAQIRLQYKPARSAWRFTGGCDLPTGQTGLSEAESRVAARVMASRVLDLRLKRPGEGLDLFAGLSYGYPVGRNTALGLAAAGYWKGAYDLYTTTGGATVSADPGERLHLSLQLLAREHDQDPEWTFRSNLATQFASRTSIEQQASRADISEGAQLTLDLSYDRRLGDNTRGGLLLYLLARDDSRSDEARIVAEEVLGIATRWVSEVGLFYARPLLGTRARFTLAQTAYRMDSSDGVNSRMTTLGIESERDVHERLVLEGALQFSFGKTPWDRADETGGWEKRSLTGLQARLQGTYRLQAGR
jgi:hypothetical protein